MHHHHVAHKVREKQQEKLCLFFGNGLTTTHFLDFQLLRMFDLNNKCVILKKLRCKKLIDSKQKRTLFLEHQSLWHWPRWNLVCVDNIIIRSVGGKSHEQRFSSALIYKEKSARFTRSTTHQRGTVNTSSSATVCPALTLLHTQQ